MTVIREHAEHPTLINVFTVEPERARQLAELLSTATDEVIKHLDGFISANIHVSTDGTRVVNYAQWRDAEAFQAMLQNPAAQKHMAEGARLATAYDPHLYTVESVHTAEV
ncbi:antibiotic biosynthesis monooxygenase family protein [uncultured Mycobacterium sp.]|uniref:antibiotic biosynthesis monooxygenase family protein n=1 Tax=uncultured Mycobacterium sp. TaxID=171292 RepID=UPI0035CA8D01